MKKITALLLLLLLTLFGCQKSGDIKIGDSIAEISKQHRPFISLNSLTVFRTEDTYTAVIGKNGTVQKTAKFSSNRKCLNANGITPVNNKALNYYLDKTLSELEEKSGAVHIDIGSGFYIPAYITENGYLIYFELDNDTVCKVTKCDIINNVITDEREQVNE